MSPIVHGRPSLLQDCAPPPPTGNSGSGGAVPVGARMGYYLVSDRSHQAPIQQRFQSRMLRAERGNPQPRKVNAAGLLNLVSDFW